MRVFFIILSAVLFFFCTSVFAASSVPLHLDKPKDDGHIYIGSKKTNLDSELQSHLSDYLEKRHSPIAAVVVLDAKDGRVLAMAQGRSPKKWDSDQHTALYSSFPAASLFKTVVTAAAFEMTSLENRQDIGLFGGCANVRASGVWMRDELKGRHNRMDLRQAYGHSCNGFFAKLGVNELGIGILSKYATKFGWNRKIPADFEIPESPIHTPKTRFVSTHTVGKFSAGFGMVGINAFHAAWMMHVIARDGDGYPIRLFADTPAKITGEPLLSPMSAFRFREIMDATVRGGTATFAFKGRKFWRLRRKIGGKTGTLTGKSPKGLTTWFAGMMPLDDPKYVVAAVVVLDEKIWHAKGPTLAAEAFWYLDQRDRKREKEARKSSKVSSKQSASRSM